MLAKRQEIFRKFKQAQKEAMRYGFKQNEAMEVVLEEFLDELREEFGEEELENVLLSSPSELEKEESEIWWRFEVTLKRDKLDILLNKN